MKYTITMEVEVPDGVSVEDAVEWIRFETNDNGEMRGGNAIGLKELEPRFPIEIRQGDRYGRIVFP